ncbi:substrate-binding domain-containing protein [Glycomyces tarimensis]
MVTGPLDTPGGVAADGGLHHHAGPQGDHAHAGPRRLHPSRRRAGDARAPEEYPRPGGVFVASDLMAAGALQALHVAGRGVPEDVAGAGFDDSAIATATKSIT